MKKILFIEDESTIQKAISRYLEQEGYKVKNALDGEIGLKSAKEIKPDLILLDLILPKKDGFDVLRELKKDESTKNIPVIALTNLEESDNIEKVLALGATAYLIKANYSLEEIAKKIKQILNQ